MNNFIQSDTTTPRKTASPSLASVLTSEGGFDVQRWQRYVEQEIGFVLPDVQLQWLINAIDQTAVSHRLTSQQLWYQLPNNAEMRQQLLDKVLIHESRFFRHKPSIDFVTECALAHQQQLANTAIDDSAKALFRIWSAGCASGQETWSLAMSLASEQVADYTILGTDISQQAIKKSRLGQYHQRQQSLIPQSCQQFVQPLSTEHATDKSSLSTIEATANAQSHWQVAPVLQRHVRFALHNIIEKKPPTSHLQNIIICQNMLLYFRKFDQRDILARLADQCALGGYIILAPGEALFWRPSNMRRIAHQQVNAWQKIRA